ncbi:protein UNC 41, b [Trichuris trichiura]|uniref:Protein UNC 41, b n=1 Tax=Trichuris trichiura TaxID=36087 RepID=A0A077Z8L4_TRITR|nr:protein UNC 41, b [Trichuris trichiura]
MKSQDADEGSVNADTNHPSSVEHTSSSDWLEFQRMSDEVKATVSGTQKKLKELEASSALRFIPEKPYETDPAATASYLEAIESEDNQDRASWKPIKDQLDEEIKKQRDLLKPKRPPPPKASESASTNLFGTQREGSPYAKAYPSWDDENAVEFYSQIPDHPQSLAQSHLPENHNNAYSASVRGIANAPLKPPTAAANEATGCSVKEAKGDKSSSEDEDGPQSAMHMFSVNAPAAKRQPFEGSPMGDGEDSSGKPLASAEENTDNKTGFYKWTSFNTFSQLPSSESGFFSGKEAQTAENSADPFAPAKPEDIFSSVLTMPADPFEVVDPEKIVNAAKEDAQRRLAEHEVTDDINFFASCQPTTDHQQTFDPANATFQDNFVPSMHDHSPSPPLFEEDDSEPLEPFYPPTPAEGWNLHIRYPIKKKLVGERCWKPVHVRLANRKVVQIAHSSNDKSPFQEFALQPTYCLTTVALQQYDSFGKIHATKLQHVLYKERVGIRPGQIPRLVEGQFTKLGMPLEHAAQTVQLVKFGSLDAKELNAFVASIEDALFKLEAKREQPGAYKQDEIQVHCYDEYVADVSRTGLVKSHRARVRIFCLAFVTGMPWVEIGLNDRRRQGLEVVRRKDIMPMYTERWIRFEECEFHSTVDKEAYDRDQVIRLKPLDACFVEVFRFRVRPPKLRELPLRISATMNIMGSKIEIRIECMVAGFCSRKARQVPCEDIQIRFPIPEAWIYLFREERYWGYGSVHAKLRRPGKVKNIRDRLMGMVQPLDSSLMEVAIGDAKYEHVYRSLVWRIPRLPEKSHEAYKTHLFKCRFELTSFDMMPEAFIPTCEVEFTMPIATVSNTVIRSVAVDQHEDPEHVEKWVRYLSKYSYTVEIDYVQTSELQIDAITDPTIVNPEATLEKEVTVHKPEIDTNVAKELHEGYRINFSPAEQGRKDSITTEENRSSSSDDEESKNEKSHFPLVQINMAGYGY